jgi:putative ABC transport system permease protein
MFVFNMAWRDSRRNRARLILFISAIVAGIAALTAVRSFSVNLTSDIDRESKTLLGADLMLDSRAPAPASLLDAVAGPGAQRSSVVNFVSMVRFTRNGGTRLCQIRAIEGDYPYYGEWKTEPAAAWRTFRQGRKALVEHALMLQFGIQPGDSVQIGEATFPIEGDLLSSPGRAGIASSIAPVVFIPRAWLDSTRLIQRGSRLNYQYYVKWPAGVDADARIRPFEKELETVNLDWETVESRKAGIGNAFGNFSTFLNLVGFVALLLGCVGVAGAVHLYIKDKLPTVAILRCLGASGRKAFFVYLIQVAGIGLIGAIAGALLGSFIQIILPWLAKDLLPIATVSTELSWTTVGQGVLLGVAVSVLFALLPLAGILRTSPLRTLRTSYGESEQVNLALRWLVYLLLAGAVAGFTYWLVRDWMQTGAFLGGLAAAFVVLFVLAFLLTRFLRRFFPRSWSYVWRQGVANLFRPENQTTLLIVIIGLGTMLLSTLFLTQSMLLRQLEFAGSGKQPNMVLFDIQSPDRDSVTHLVERHEMPLLQQIAVVTMRMEKLNGLDKTQDQADSTTARPQWVWNHEYRTTFRDTLTASEAVIEGAWDGRHEAGEPVRISISENLKRELRASVGDTVVFNVQGQALETVIGSVRKVTFNQIQPAFMVVFPGGVLEEAPQIHVIVSRVGSAEQSAAFQSELVRLFPNVSAIDLTAILRSVDEVLSKVSFVIRFMALFCILTGLLVLISSIYQSKFARVRESVLLRTLGASRKQILWINALEYFLLGSLACIAGLGLSMAGTWALARFAFNLEYTPSYEPLLITFLAITGLTVLIGLLNSRDVVRKPPLEVLRAEV